VRTVDDDAEAAVASVARIAGVVQVLNKLGDPRQ
jgi:hypothetical protein